MFAIDIRNLSKSYSNEKLVLNDISISVKNGEFFSLLGKNGAGKSTTIGILTSLIKKDCGKVYVSGYDLDVNSIKIKSLIGFVPQEYNFNQFECVLDIILNQAGFYGIQRSIARERAFFYLKLFHLWKQRVSIGMGLSGGMKRRLMIIKALIHNPDILILDEPTSGVDISSRYLIWNFLKYINKCGKTIILTTHYLEEVENLCNNVAIIEDGSILLKTTVNKLLTKIKNRFFLIEINNINLISEISFLCFRLSKKIKNIIEVVVIKNQTLNLLLILLIKRGVMIKNIKSKNSGLEKIFIDITT